MLTYRWAKDRGGHQISWLKARHSFSFGSYVEPNYNGFRDLCVINEDVIAGGGGFATHPHADMEIITYVISGALEHRDTLGNSSIIRPGDVQRMSAGTGIQHSEFNHFKDQSTHLYQIWLVPDQAGHQPSYAQQSFQSKFSEQMRTLVVSRDGRDGSLTMNQDSDVWVGRFQAEQTGQWKIRHGYGWIQLVRGRLQIDTDTATMGPGDGLAINQTSVVMIKALEASEFIFFDLV